jgi:chromosome segregation ATPase
MKSAPPETRELLLRLREQLILAQVRIMELEDQRDELTPQVATLEGHLTEAQGLADRTLEENTHLRRVHDDDQAQLQHQRHLVHVAHEALAETRRQLGEAESALADLRRQHAGLTSQYDQLATRLDSTTAEARQLATELDASRLWADQQAARIQQLDAERQAMRASRSWRWTAWLRALERRLGGSRQA